MSRLLNLPARNRIVEVLVEWPVLQQNETRQEILRHLSFHTEIAAGGNTEDHVGSIVRTCATQPRGLAALIEAVRFQDKNQSFDQLLAVLDPLFEHIPVRWSELIPLKNILRSGPRPPDDQLRDAWCSVTGKSLLPMLDPKANPLLCYLDFLAEERALRTEAPLFAFLEQLRTEIGSSPQLEEWEQRVATRLGLDLSAIRASARRAKAKADAERILTINPGEKPLLPACAVLVVRIQPSKMKAYFFVQGWLYRDGKRKQVHPVDKVVADGAVSEQLLEKMVAALIQGALRWPGGVPCLRIEVILPLALLDQTIDDWMIPVSSLQSDAIGSRWPLVLRSWDRLVNPNFAPAYQVWQNKWGRLKLEWATEGRKYWWNATTDSAESLREKLEPDVLAFFAAHLVAPNGVLPRQHVLDAVLGAGVPVALWLRGYAGDAETRRTELGALLDVGSHDHCPDAVLAKRKSILRAEKSIPKAVVGTERVALLWDPPERIPPQLTEAAETADAPSKPRLRFRRLQPPL